MADIRTIKRRLKSVNNTKQITKAMEMVAASKMRKAQNQVLASRPYVLHLQQTLTNLAALIKGSGAQIEHPLLTVRPVKKTYFIALAPNKGLCGGLPSTITKTLAKELITYKDKNEYSIVAVGKKVVNFVASTKLPLLAEFTGLPDNPSFSDIAPLGEIIIDDYIEGKVDEVKIIYSHFYSTLIQKPVIRTLLPINADDLFVEDIESEIIQEQKERLTQDYLFEPNPKAIFDYILPYFVKMSIHQSLLESKASEHSSRMVAMKNASDQANELIGDLTLTYNRVRQEAITKEVAEIAAGSQAIAK